jgi:hypothetical protein
MDTQIATAPIDVAQPAQYPRLSDVYRSGCDSQRPRHLCDRLLLNRQSIERLEGRWLKLRGNLGKQVSQDGSVMLPIPPIQVRIGLFDPAEVLLEVASPDGPPAATFRPTVPQQSVKTRRPQPRSERSHPPGMLECRQLLVQSGQNLLRQVFSVGRRNLMHPKPTAQEGTVQPIEFAPGVRLAARRLLQQR